MSDLIDRQKVIDAFLNLANDIWNQGACVSWADAFRVSAEMITDMPSAQPEPQWIPVRERLPEINKPVLVWLYDEYYLSELHSIGGVLYWDFDQFDLCGDEFNDVIAWMPLPEPYKEDDAV